ITANGAPLTANATGISAATISPASVRWSPSRRRTRFSTAPGRCLRWCPALLMARKGYRERGAGAPRGPSFAGLRGGGAAHSAKACAKAMVLVGRDDADLDPAVRRQALDQRLARHVFALDHGFPAATADRADPFDRHALPDEIVADAARAAGREVEVRLGVADPV